MASFSSRLFYPSSKRHSSAGYPMQGSAQSINIEEYESMTQKIHNSICTILEASDCQNLSGSTKYLALSVFYRYLTSHFCHTDEQFGILILCSLRLASKFNQMPPKCSIFENPRYLALIQTTRSIAQILQFQFQVFAELDFQIYTKTPYDYLDEQTLAIQFPTNINNVMRGFIDFALTLIQLSGNNAKQIFAGCLFALTRNAAALNQNILAVITKIIGETNKAQIVGNIILQKWASFLQSQQ